MISHLYRPPNWQEEFIDILKKAITKAGSKSCLARDIGVDYSTVLSWVRGAIPQDENMRKIEQYVAQEGLK